ncbi:hypothetical protein [Mesorhizobium sp.]|uniref:hypothetical protein n=1 Tax=Mesorhizobium sp. TaxID=1871066 RepID=UPI000FE92371|nr:hypothetical protein [Mesorhizobium sp.]RWM38734.1 MAG: hypothetical protein EOR75_17490 [Mesorhizobium sp.]
MDKFLKAVASIASGPIVTWVADWLHIFNNTYVIRPNSPDSLPATAIAVGAVLTVSLTAIYFNAAPALLKRRAFWTGGAALFVLIAIFIVRSALDGSVSRETANALYRAYDYSTFAFLALVIVTILFAILYQFNSSGNGELADQCQN